jgi:hypothetical protein
MVKKFSLISSLLLATLLAEAKRGVPTEVLPVTVGNIEYSAPHRNGTHKQMGFIEARVPKSGELIWSRQIYAVKYDPDLEGDVQDVFIKSITVEGNNLIIINEKNSKYQLNLNSLEVKVLHGSLVEETKIRPLKK